MIARPPLRVRQNATQSRFSVVDSQQPPAMPSFSPKAKSPAKPKKSKSAKKQRGF